MIDEYLKILSSKNAELPEGYHDIVKQLNQLKKSIANPMPLALVIVILFVKILDDGNTAWIADLEYSGMNDPMWDLGDLR